MLKKKIGELVFKANGWTYELNQEAISDPKQVLIGFPHTSNLDTILAMGLFLIADLNSHILIKQELFKFPLSPILKALGGIPVDRKNAKNMVSLMIDTFNQNEKFTLVIAPEATRSKTGEKPTIKTGFWHIAKATGVPIALMYSDPITKQGGIFAKVIPSDDMYTDLELIKSLYQPLNIEVNIPSRPLSRH